MLRPGGRRGPVRFPNNSTLQAYLAQAPVGTIARMETLLGVVGHWIVTPSGVQLLGTADLTKIIPAAPGLVVGSDIIALGTADDPTWADGGLKLNGSGQAALPGLGLYGDEPIGSVTAVCKVRQTGALGGAYAMCGFSMSSRTLSLTGGLAKSLGPGSWYRLKGSGDPATGFTTSGLTSANTLLPVPSASYTNWTHHVQGKRSGDGAEDRSVHDFGSWPSGGQPAVQGRNWGITQNVLGAGWDTADREIMLAAGNGGGGSLEMVVTSIKVDTEGLI